MCIPPSDNIGYKLTMPTDHSLFATLETLSTTLHIRWLLIAPRSIPTDDGTHGVFAFNSLSQPLEGSALLDGPFRTVSTPVG